MQPGAARTSRTFAPFAGVAITTTAANDQQARALLIELGLPFAADGGNR